MMFRNGWVYWPMEEMLSPAAMAHIENAIRTYEPDDAHPLAGNTREEILDCANKIRACLQHIAEEKRSPPPPPTDEDLLA